MQHLTRLLFNTLVLGSICAATALSSADARACSPPAPGLSSHLPVDGAYYPGNGILLFDGFDISTAQVTVTVDGAAASLVDASAAFPTNVSAIAVRVNPKPNPDQKVTISGSFCTGCPVESFTYTARADDLVAPEGVVSARYNVYDYADFKSGGGDCQIDSDLALWVHAQTNPANEEEAPAILQIEAFADSALSQPLGQYSSLITTNEMVWNYRVTTDTLQGANPKAVCFRLSTKDLSGNNGPAPLVLCNACYTRTDAQGTMSVSPPDEPVWGESDVIKDGPCDFSAGVGGGPTEDTSCSYHPSRSGTAAWMLVACAALGFGVARKRVRRPAK